MTVDRRAVLRAAALAAFAAGCAPAARRTLARPTTGPAPATRSPSAAPSPSPHASATTASGGPATEIVRGPSTAPALALTFHGAGDPALARALLGEAERAGARLTILAVGTWLDANPEMARRILDGGHELGNHTYTHPSLRRLGPRATYDEITRCRDVLHRLTGAGGVWFRPSGTQHATPLILEEAGRAGYRHCLSYDVDPRDYQDPGAAAVRERTLAAVRRGSIVSLHLGHRGTVEALPGILDGLHTRGLKPVTVSTLLPTT